MSECKKKVWFVVFLIRLNRILFGHSFILTDSWWFLSIGSIRVVTFDNRVIRLDSNITIETPIRRECVLHDPIKNRLRRRGRSEIPSYDFIRSEPEIRFIAWIINVQAAWSTSRVSRDRRGVLNQRNNWSCLVQVLLHIQYRRRVVVIPKILERV